MLSSLEGDFNGSSPSQFSVACQLSILILLSMNDPSISNSHALSGNRFESFCMNAF